MGSRNRVDSPFQTTAPDIPPKRVLRSHGNVESSSPSSFTLSTITSSESWIILDYGRAEGGNPVSEISNATSKGNADIQFQVIYSETIEEIDHDTGDGPFFLFSNAMDSYRAVTHTIKPSVDRQTVRARHAQRSQRYQKIRLLTPDSTITFEAIGFNRVRPEAVSKGSFRCSDPLLTRIWEEGVRTVDMCTVHKGETAPAWDVSEEGTKVYGQHWAPCRTGTRWTDVVVQFNVRIENEGASWGIHMVANGLIFCLNKESRTLTAHEGLSHESSVFPSHHRGTWHIDETICLDSWTKVTMLAVGDSVKVSLDGIAIALVEQVNLHPLLGGSGKNSGSVAFGGPEGWVATYRDLSVTDYNGQMLYSNALRLQDAARTFADFAVGSNELACTIDGAKRDRSTFGGDLHISGRSVAYSTADFDAVRGSIQLLLSHQRKGGYLGNLCPIQAPLHSEDEEPPTYAFYSLTYALLLVVAIKDYWLHSGDSDLADLAWPALVKLDGFVKRLLNSDGLVAAPPDLSLTFFPLVGPVFGVSTQVNLAYYNALLSMASMSPSADKATELRSRAEKLRESIVQHLYDHDSGVLRLGDRDALTGIAQDVNSFGVSIGVSPAHSKDLINLTQPDFPLPPAFQDLGPRFDNLKLCSPYTTNFAVEACFARGHGVAAVDLIRRVWGQMADEENPNYSGCHWEAMTLEGTPYHHSTSLVHAWSTGPVYLLPMYLAGLRAMEPGWRRWEARPVDADLSYAQASVPTPRGDIQIGWQSDNKTGRGQMSCSAPAGCEGTIWPPEGWRFKSLSTTCISEGALQLNGGSLCVFLEKR